MSVKIFQVSYLKIFGLESFIRKYKSNIMIFEASRQNEFKKLGVFQYINRMHAKVKGPRRKGRIIM